MVGWIKVAGSRSEKLINEGVELHREIFEDIRKSHEEWKLAHCMFEEAIEQDQIDYAIFTLEAAERRYQMHLRRAKQCGISGSTQECVYDTPYSNLSKRMEG
ncbi:DUF2508 family protein [Paenibacillus sp. Marseille-Q4541]|uniref:DUF2508 family protein n=1 Tax=Paenibacillus sp. Marseille-Q4541 TaxID=2831522 RepID=UPI001BAB062D|nr:DUF2508 family protein [Paenibacillus sp. Marseille-Q4541]